MKTVLVIDKLFNNRSGRAEMDMYEIMSECYNLAFNVDRLLTKDYDILFLGAYHYRMGLDIYKVLEMNTKPVFVCQADNEEFASLPYDYGNATIICKYLPSESLKGYKTKLLNWYLKPFKLHDKTCDIAFICSMYGERIEYAELIKQVCDKNKWTCVVGEYHNDYYELIAKCRVMIIYCDRKCLTLKYLEATYSGMSIVGTKPIYPANELNVIECDLSNTKDIERCIKIALKSQPNKPYISREDFKKQICGILK